MTTIGVTFGGQDFSDYAFSADIWRDTLAGVGRWEVIMDPLANYWPWNLPFTPGNPVVITINGSPTMEGIIDNVEPYLEGAEKDLWRLEGRDWGYELASRYYTAPRGDYVNMRADAIINAVFTAVGTAITPPGAPFTAPFITYEWKPRTYLGDGVRDICDMIGYDFYVRDDDPARTLHFFPQGDATQHTGVNLEMIPGSLTNNILQFEMGEQLGSDVRNSIEVVAGGLTDHWTDMNATDWTPAANTAVSNRTDVFLEGKSSIQALSLANRNVVTIILDFSGGRYSQGTSIDMSEPCMGRYDYLCHYPNRFPIDGVGLRRVRLMLQSTNGARIRYYRTITALLARNSDATQTIWDDEWQIVDKIPFGEQDIERNAVPVVSATKGYWVYSTFNPPLGPTFDWTQVEQVWFTNSAIPPLQTLNAGDYFLVDGLTIPNVEVRSLIQDAASIVLHTQRDKDFYRPDIRNQLELDAASAAILPTMANPLEKLSITATGQTLSDYAGQSLNVQANNFGLGLPRTRYRIVNLHHMVRRSSQESDVPGWNFLTEYDLIRDEFGAGGGGKQYYDPQRFLDSVDARRGRLNKTRIQQKQRERSRVNIG